MSDFFSFFFFSYLYLFSYTFYILLNCDTRNSLVHSKCIPVPGISWNPVSPPRCARK